MEAAALIDPEFWESDAPVLMGHPDNHPATLPGLIYFQTSGSTGEPKWIGLSRDALMTSATAVNAHLRVDRTSCWTLALPLHHVGGFGVAARARVAGCRIQRYEGKWNAEGFTRWLGESGGTHLSLVPTQVHDLVAAGLGAPACLRAVVVGGGKLPETTGRAARELGWPVLASYGMTEAGSQIATQGVELLEEPYVTGMLELLPCWEAATGEGGHLMIAGPALFQGTLIRDGAVWTYEERRSEWFTTSDVGEVRGREVLVAGRADSLVKILGELVDPVTVEGELLALSGAAPGTAVVLALPDPRAGNKLVLVHENVTTSEQWARVLDRYHADCPGFCRIHSIFGVRSIPKSPLGKPLRAALSRIVAEGSI